MGIMQDTNPQRLVGYARVSTEDQDATLQIKALRDYGVQEDLIYVDKESGAKANRSGLLYALKACRAGGELVFWKLDRLGRDVVEVLLTLRRLEERGVRYRSLTESFVTPDGRATPMGNAFITLTAMFAEMERKLISERTKAGQRVAKERGVKFGRKTFAELYIETGRVKDFQRDLQESGDTLEAVRKRHKIPLGTFKKWYRVFTDAPLDIDEMADDQAENESTR